MPENLPLHDVVTDIAHAMSVSSYGRSLRSTRVAASKANSPYASGLSRTRTAAAISSRRYTPKADDMNLALWRAVWVSDIETVRWALGGNGRNHLTCRGQHQAPFYARVPGIRKEVIQYIPDYASDTGWTAAHVAARDNNVAILKLLCQSGWSMKKLNKDRMSPQEVAKKHGHVIHINVKCAGAGNLQQQSNMRLNLPSSTDLRPEPVAKMLPDECVLTPGTFNKKDEPPSMLGRKGGIPKDRSLHSSTTEVLEGSKNITSGSVRSAVQSRHPRAHRGRDSQRGGAF
jgi:hypothetical protein